MRILYHAINGSGLGHLVRMCTIAVALRKLDGEIHQLVVTSSPQTELPRRLQLPFLVVPEDDGIPFEGVNRRTRTIARDTARAILHLTIDEYDPDVVVFDTHFPAMLIQSLAADGRTMVLVLRRCREPYLQRLLELEILAEFRLVLVPHEQDEFRAGLSCDMVAALEAHPGLIYCGPVVRPAMPEATGEVRSRLGVPEDARLVVITSGSGGYRRQAAQLLGDAATAVLSLLADDDRLLVLAVGGPNGGPVPVPPGCSYAQSEPDLPTLYGVADLVVGHAGYNTVHEVAQAGARAVFIEAPRWNEDQAATTRAIVAEGGAASVQFGASMETLTAAVRTMLAAPRPRPRHFNGRTRAAAAVLSTLRRVPRLALGEDLVVPSTWERVATLGGLAGRLADVNGSADVAVQWDQVAAACRACRPGADGALPGQYPAVVTWYLDLRDGAAGELGMRALRALDAADEVGVDRGHVVLVGTDRAGGGGVTDLADRVALTGVRGLIVRVPSARSSGQAAEAAAALERCRRRHPKFLVDLTPTEAPLLAVRWKR